MKNEKFEKSHSAKKTDWGFFRNHFSARSQKNEKAEIMIFSMKYTDEIHR